MAAPQTFSAHLPKQQRLRGASLRTAGGAPNGLLQAGEGSQPRLWLEMRWVALQLQGKPL